MNVALKIDPTNVNALAQAEMNYGENCITYSLISKLQWLSILLSTLVLNSEICRTCEPTEFCYLDQSIFCAGDNK